MSVDADFMPYVMHHNKSYTSRSKVYSKKRMLEMSEPKQDLLYEWLSDPRSRNRVQWGTQEELTPVSSTAKSYTSSPRISSLSQPKRHVFIYGFKERKSSTDSSNTTFNRPSAQRVLNCATLKAVCSPHTEYLSKPQRTRKLSTDIVCQNSTVKRENSTSSEGRLQMLAKHKELPVTYLPARILPLETSELARKATASGRLETLSAHKKQIPGPFRDPIWQVTDTVKRNDTSSRICDLSKHKSVSEDYQSPLNACRVITAASRKAVATVRISELSVPIARESMDRVRYNPSAFTVSPAAKQAKANSRIIQLAQPISR